jgi:hypothetical protein
VILGLRGEAMRHREFITLPLLGRADEVIE